MSRKRQSDERGWWDAGLTGIYNSWHTGHSSIVGFSPVFCNLLPRYQVSRRRSIHIVVHSLTGLCTYLVFYTIPGIPAGYVRYQATYIYVIPRMYTSKYINIMPSTSGMCQCWCMLISQSQNSSLFFDAVLDLQIFFAFLHVSALPSVPLSPVAWFPLPACLLLPVYKDSNRCRLLETQPESKRRGCRTRGGKPHDQA